MRTYTLHRLEYRANDGEHRGFQWLDSLTLADVADDAARKSGLTVSMAVVHFGTRKSDILELLNYYASHADNG